MRLWKVVGLIGMLSTLTGCVSLSTPSTSNIKFNYLTLKKRQARVSKQRHFVANGAFSIVEADKNPVLANYQWDQRGKQFYRIRVYSPLDIFNAIIVGRPHSVTFWKNNKEHATASSPEQLIRREMGWNLPIQNLYYWIRGVIAPGQHKATSDAYGHLTTLQQNGWTIQFSQYTTVDNYDLPQKLILERPQLRVTLVIKQWKLMQ